MPAGLLEIIKEYAVFETAVRQHIADLCAPYCSVCENVCCRPDFCRENIDSPFLTLLSVKTIKNEAYSAECGWLTSTGCALNTGRPPVCYQFSCNKILDALSDDRQRYLYRVLSNLVPHIGKRALGHRHLVEIMDASQLARVKINRFRKRLAAGRRALQIIQSINGDDLLKTAILEELSKIV